MLSSMPTIPTSRQISTVIQEQTTYKRNRHAITLVLSQLSDLKVEEVQRINVGDIISDLIKLYAKLYPYTLIYMWDSIR